MSGLRHLIVLVRLLIEDRQQLALENVALRHQLAVLKPVREPTQDPRQRPDVLDPDEADAV